MTRVRSVLTATICGAALVVPLRAHHSAAAAYDAGRTVTIRGIVSKVEWRNPHAYFFVDVKDTAGHVTTWSLEAQSPAALARHGFRKDEVRPGDRVEADLMPSVVGANRGLIRVLRCHGKVFHELGRDNER
jgi:hypothetical protein